MRLKHFNIGFTYNNWNEVEYVCTMYVHPATGTFYDQMKYNTKILHEKASLSNPDPV